MRSRPSPWRVPWPREAAKLAAVLLLVTSYAPAIIRGSFDGNFQASCSGDSDSGDGSGLWSGDEEDWWLENITNGTELCSGVMDSNSSDFIYSHPEDSTSGNNSFSPCNDFYDRCDIHDFITLTTDPISYINAHSTIITTVEPNATSSYSKLYYKLCYNTFGEPADAEVIECVSNGTMMVSEYQWKKSGEAILTVHVFTSPSFNDSDFLDCGIARITVANDSGLNLTVQLLNEALQLDKDTEAYRGEGESLGGSEDNSLFTMGNITFVTVTKLMTNTSQKPTYYYTFKVKGPSWEDSVCSLQPNWTRDCQEVGGYNYSIHAIAKLNKTVAYHAHITGEFSILEAVSNAEMLVGTNNSVKVGSQKHITITAEGSTPIIVCWFETKAPMQDPMNITTPEPPRSPTTPPPPPPPMSPDHQHSMEPPLLENCIFLNDSNSTVYRENRTFNTVGNFQYVAHFYNRASQVQRNFTYHVEPGQSPAVVGSATAIVVLGVLVALVIVTVVLIAGGYIPYRKYKNRMTETADFRFVDLSENGKAWDRFKLKTNQFMDYFRQRRHSEKIGLVNLGSVPILEERRLFYGTNTLTQFAPNETM